MTNGDPTTFLIRLHRKGNTRDEAARQPRTELQQVTQRIRRRGLCALKEKGKKEKKRKPKGPEALQQAENQEWFRVGCGQKAAPGARQSWEKHRLGLKCSEQPADGRRRQSLGRGTRRSSPLLHCKRHLKIVLWWLNGQRCQKARKKIERFGNSPQK